MTPGPRGQTPPCARSCRVPEPVTLGRQRRDAEGLSEMFTGHIRELGLIESFDGAQVRVRAPQTAAAVEPGGSVCVSGIRLTVPEVTGAVLAATIATETRRRSTFDSLNKGARVNLELPLAAGDALDGHLVQGYVDGVGKVARVDAEEGCLRVWIRPPERLISRLVAKSPIAVDGVSVTIADRLRDRFSIVVVPATAARHHPGPARPRHAGEPGAGPGRPPGRAAGAGPLGATCPRSPPRWAGPGTSAAGPGWTRPWPSSRPAAGWPSGIPTPSPRATSCSPASASGPARSGSCSPRYSGTPPCRARPRSWTGWTSARRRAAATTTAPPSTSRSTWPARRAPGCRRPSGPRRCGGWPARPPCRATS